MEYGTVGLHGPELLQDEFRLQLLPMSRSARVRGDGMPDI